MADRGADGAGGPPFVLTAHAIAALSDRGIDPVWVERVLRRPERIEEDRDDPALWHAVGPIEERGNRVLRVVYNHTTDPWRIVTVFFDRRLRNTL